MENDLKGNENYFKLTGGLSYRGFELLGFHCISKAAISMAAYNKNDSYEKFISTKLATQSGFKMLFHTNPCKLPHF